MQNPYSDTAPVTAIVSDDYRAERAALMADPILRAMAADLIAGAKAGKIEFVDQGWVHPDTAGGSPTTRMMSACNDRYRALGGVRSMSIGGVAGALWSVLLPELKVEYAWA